MPTRIKIQSFTVKNYKSIKSCELDFASGVVGLIGENATGKSNIGRAIITYFKLIRDHIPSHIDGNSWSVESAKGYNIWQALATHEYNPHALLRNVAIGETIELSGTFRLINQSHRHAKSAQGNSSERDASVLPERVLAIRFSLELKPNGESDEMIFQPKLWVHLDDKVAKLEEFKDLHIWNQFQAERVKALRPFADISSDMNAMRNKGVPGRNAFSGLNNDVKHMHPHFAEIDYIENRPTGIHGDIQGLDEANMSSGNLQLFHMLSSLTKAKESKLALLHVEEPELSLHPNLQRKLVSELINAAKENNIPLLIETHSPHVLTTLFQCAAAVYRLSAAESKPIKGIRLSVANKLTNTNEMADTLKSIGVDAAFAALGGVVIVTCGPTDVPVYQNFLSRFKELELIPYTFLPIGNLLQSEKVSLSDIAQLTSRAIVVADGHFKEDVALENRCREAGVVCVQLERWGVENFFTADVLGKIPEIKIKDLTLDPMKSIADLTTNFCKGKHSVLLAPYVTIDYLKEQRDFMALVAEIQKTYCSLI